MRIPATFFGAVLFYALPAVPSPELRGEAASDSIRAGPVYTALRPDGGVPEFPDVQILVELPLPAAASGLTPDTFRVRADGKFYAATRVQTMASSGQATAVAVVLDASGSMHGAPLFAVKAGLARFAGDAGERDRIAIETLADDTRWDVNWGDSPEQIRAVIAKLDSRGKMTHLWDGLFQAVGQLPESPAARRVIVISDGHDEGSTHPLEEVIAAYQQRRVPIDAIGVTRSDPAYLANLQRLCDETGGQFRAAKSGADLERLVAGGIERLRSLPVVSFRLNDLRADGKVHEFEVFWKHEGTESSAKVTMTAPASAESVLVAKRLWLSLAGLIAAALLAGAILVGRRSRQPAGSAQPPVPAPQPVEISFPTTMPPAPAALAGFSPRAQSRPEPAASTPAAPAPFSARSRTQLSARFTEPEPTRPAAWLFGEAGFGAGQWFAVDAREYWIGAEDNNHLQITDDPTVSGNHACIVFETDVLGIFDYNSTNGTRVNEEIVRDYRRLLQPGDRIRVGRSTFALHMHALSGQPGPEPAP